MVVKSKAKDIELKGHTDSVDQLCWDPKHADLLATASGDKTVRLWDARSEYKSLVLILVFAILGNTLSVLLFQHNISGLKLYFLLALHPKFQKPLVCLIVRR